MIGIKRGECVYRMMNRTVTRPADAITCTNINAYMNFHHTYFYRLHYCYNFVALQNVGAVTHLRLTGDSQFIYTGCPTRYRTRQ